VFRCDGLQGLRDSQAGSGRPHICSHSNEKGHQKCLNGLDNDATRPADQPAQLAPYSLTRVVKACTAA
jgi:hypothetical protein